MKNKYKIQKTIAQSLIIAMCGFPITGCSNKDENIAFVNGVHVNANNDSYINIDYFLEDPGDKIFDVREHYFYAYDYRPSERTPEGEGSFVLNVPEGYEVYNYETLSYYYSSDIIKVTFVNTKPVYVESVKHEDRDDNLGKKYYYWDYCYPGKTLELDMEEPSVNTKTIN